MTAALTGPAAAEEVLGGRPGKIIAVGLNFRSHLRGRPLPEKPELFLKPSSSLEGPGAVVTLPEGASRPQAEGELGVLVGMLLRDVSVEEALDGIAGYTCAFDITDRAWQQGDRQWWRAKGCDTWCPVGPVVVPAASFGPATARLTTRCDGKIAQDAPLADMVFGVAEVLAFASRHMTLEPGDLVLMGTPGETPDLRAGMQLAVTITGIGTLEATVTLK